MSHDKYHILHHILESHRVMSHDKSHDKYGKVVYRPYSSYISNIQEIKENFIKFSLLNQTWSMINVNDKTSNLQVLLRYKFTSGHMIKDS